MKSFSTAVLYGFLIWLIVFLIAILIFPLHETNRVFFESIMPVAISIATTFFAFVYLIKVETNFIREGLYFGVITVVVCWIIDSLMMLSPSPMQMTLSEYFFDIGFTYFMILPITLGFGCVLAYSKSKDS